MHDTPDTPTIESLVDLRQRATSAVDVTAADTLKNVLVKVAHARLDEWELLAVGVPGDREVDDKRLEAALAPGRVRPARRRRTSPSTPFLVRGYIGPKALRDQRVRYLVDPRVVDGTAWITGADEPGKHVVGPRRRP